MRRLIGRSLLALAASGFATLTWAVGPYDGIYQIGSSDDYYSVHQNGDHMVIGRFFYNSGSSWLWSLSNGQEFAAPRLNRWDLLSGDIKGSVATLTGETNAGACVGTFTFDFSIPAIDWTGATPSTIGAQQNIDCNTNYIAYTTARGGNRLNLKKIF